MSVAEFIEGAKSDNTLMEKIQACKSVEDFIALAKAHGKTFGAEEVKAVFWPGEDELDDDALAAIAGGTCHGGPAFGRRG